MRRFTRWLCAIPALAVAAGGCVVARADTCGTAPETKSITLVADWLPWSSQGPFFAAQSKGYYQDEGLDVQIMSPPTSTDPIKLVARQRANFGMSYVPEVMMARDTGIPVVSVAALLRSFVQGMIVSPDIGVSSPEGFRGHTVGVGAMPATRAYFNTMLKSAGVKPEDVKVVDPGYSNITMLLAGQLDSISGLSYSELATANAQRAKENKPPYLFWSFSDYGVPPFYFMLLVANDDWLKQNPATACRFLRATRKGYQEFAANPDPYNQIFAKQNEVFSPEEHANMTKTTVGDWLGPDGTIFKQDESVWKAAQDWAMQQGLITIGSDPTDYFTNTYLPD